MMDPFQIATIVHSRQARVSFDQLWLDLYEKVVLETQVDKVTPLVVNPGRILLSTSRIFFQPYNNVEAVSMVLFKTFKFCSYIIAFNIWIKMLDLYHTKLIWFKYNNNNNDFIAIPNHIQAECNVH